MMMLYHVIKYEEILLSYRAEKAKFNGHGLN